MRNKKNNLLPAYKKSKLALQEVWKKRKAELPSVCGCEVDGPLITIKYFSDICAITMPECDVEPASISMFEQILLLHYLGRPFEADTPRDFQVSEWITFKQLPNAAFYDPTYQKRGPCNIVRRFARCPAELLKAGKGLDGEEGGYGDYSVILKPFPKIRAMAVLYTGDEEFPPEAEILYSADIHRYLPLEDIAVLAGIISGRLTKSADVNRKGER